MRIRQLAFLGIFAAHLAAQGTDQGFQWVGLRAGSLSFDPQEHVNAAPLFGGQVGMVFDQQHYGLSLEGFLSHPKSSLLPGPSLSHTELSVTLLTGLASSPASRLWPYLGLGLDGLSVPKINPATAGNATTKGTAAHASLGLLHRPTRGLIWGAEARYLLSFTPKDLRELQGSALIGFTWGGAGATPRSEAQEPVQPRVQAAPPVAVPPPVTPPSPTAAPPLISPAPPPQPLPIPRPMAPTPTVSPVQPQPLPVAVPRPMAAPPVVSPAPPPPPLVTAPRPVAVAAPPAPVSTPALPAKEPKAGATSTVAERLEALRQGDMARAVALGRKRIQAIPAQGWTLRLEIANLPATLQHAVEAFPGPSDLFIAPIKLRGGRTAYQLFLGDYASKAEAERAVKAVPALFLEGGQRPKVLLASEIPTQVQAGK